jgi:hypothetical protein
MPREAHSDHLARALHRLGTSTRLKGVPALHALRIGAGRVEISLAMEHLLMIYQKHPDSPAVLEARAFFQSTVENPEVCPYTPDLEREDQAILATRPLRLPWSWGVEVLRLDDPEQAVRTLHAHFYPVAWEAFREASLWDLLLEVLPACAAARPRVTMLQENRWLYDERAQQAAETLCERLSRAPDLLHDPVPVTAAQRQVFEAYAARLERATKARRWLMDTLKPPKRRRRTPSEQEAT